MEFQKLPESGNPYKEEEVPNDEEDHAALFLLPCELAHKAAHNKPS